LNAYNPDEGWLPVSKEIVFGDDNVTISVNISKMNNLGGENTAAVAFLRQICDQEGCASYSNRDTAPTMTWMPHCLKVKFELDVYGPVLATANFLAFYHG